MTYRVLITGISGFAGGYLARHALQDGASVYGVSRRDVIVPGVTWFQGDLHHDAVADHVVSESSPDIVFDLAAVTPAHGLNSASTGWLTHNSLTTFHLLDAVRRHCPGARVIVISSSAVYGHVSMDEQPITEHTLLNPVTLYGVSKVSQEMVSSYFAAEYGLNILRVRPFNLIGPGEPFRMLPSTLAAQVAARVNGNLDSPITIRHLATSRDYTDIRDAVKAYWLLGTQAAPNRVYNVCAGVATSLGTLVDMLLNLAQVQTPIVETEHTVRPGDVLSQCGSAVALHRATGWQPQISLQQSLADLLQSFGCPVRMGS